MTEHYEGCYEDHLECAQAEIKRLAILFTDEIRRRVEIEAKLAVTQDIARGFMEKFYVAETFVTYGAPTVPEN